MCVSFKRWTHYVLSSSSLPPLRVWEKLSHAHKEKESEEIERYREELTHTYDSELEEEEEAAAAAETRREEETKDTKGKQKITTKEEEEEEEEEKGDRNLWNVLHSQQSVVLRFLFFFFSFFLFLSI